MSDSFGILLRKHRAAARLTQEALAVRAGLSLHAVSALERGVHRSPHLPTIDLLAGALGLDPVDRDHMITAARPTPSNSGTWVAAGDHQAAAWELYVELTTRIAVARLAPDEGLLRETLTSLHSLFETTRAVLKHHGRNLAYRPPSGGRSIRSIAMTMLDDVLRPFLGRWHPLLLDHEYRRPPGVAAAAHERSWERNCELRRALVQVRNELSWCARQLAVIAELPATDTGP